MCSTPFDLTWLSVASMSVQTDWNDKSAIVQKRTNCWPWHISITKVGITSRHWSTAMLCTKETLTGRMASSFWELYTTKWALPSSLYMLPLDASFIVLLVCVFRENDHCVTLLRRPSSSHAFFSLKWCGSHSYTILTLALPKMRKPSESIRSLQNAMVIWQMH